MTRLDAFLTAILCAFMAGPAFAEQQNVDSYFPSPFGSYQQLRLVPRAALPEPCQIGTFYYGTGGTELKFCTDPQDGTTNGVWGEINGVWTQIGDRIFLSGGAASQTNLKVGIGTTAATTPLMKLQIEDGGILSLGQFGQGEVLSSPGDGPRFIWYPRKAALRIGENTGTNWDDGNIGNYSCITGGRSNMASGSYSNIQGGSSNQVTGAHSVIAGGSSNRITGQHSAIGGGESNLINANFAAINGGSTNNIQSDYGTISGGALNAIGTVAASNYSAILGGQSNTIQGGQYSVILGGNNNTINTISYATIAAGVNNRVNGQFSTILSRDSTINNLYATITGGFNNTINGNYASIPGGVNNQVTGTHSVNFHPSGGSNAIGNFAMIGGRQSINRAEYSLMITKNIDLNAASREALVFQKANAVTASTPPRGSFTLYDHNDLTGAAMRLGIGVVPNPAKQLEFQNGAYIDNTGAVCISPSLGIKCLTAPGPSDRRLKKNIEPITNALQTLSKIQGVTFQWNGQSDFASDTRRHTGFIAQEVERIFPHWISTDGKGYKSIDLRETDALMVEGVKELHAKVEGSLSKHEKKIQEINNRITGILEKQRAVLAEQTALILQQEAELSRLRNQPKGKSK